MASSSPPSSSWAWVWAWAVRWGTWLDELTLGRNGITAKERDIKIRDMQSREVAMMGNEWGRDLIYRRERGRNGER